MATKEQAQGQPQPMQGQQAPQTASQDSAAVVPTQQSAVADPKAATSNLPAQLQPIKDCFSLPRKAFVAAFANPKEGEARFAKEINFASQALLANPYLITCAQNHPDELVNAIKNVALTGSTLNPTLKLAYLVPFKGKITLMASYMGLVDILINSGLAKKVEAHPVFVGEHFEMVHGTGGYIKHVPNPWGPKTKENLLGCYFYIELVDGGQLFDALSKDEIEDIKRRSPSVEKGKTSPWDTDYIEMAKKGLALDTLIPTPKGFTTMGEIQVGDEIFNALGEVTTVTSKSEIKNLPCYKVTFQNGDSFICDHEHRWFVSGTTYKTPGWHVGETKTLAEVKKMGYPIVTPKAKPIILPDAKLPIPPYVLGYWLGNGSKGKANVTCDKKDADEIMSLLSPYYNVERCDDAKSNACTIKITCKGIRNSECSLFSQLNKLGEHDKKHIPLIYKRASIAQRIELIQGLCDSDGCVHSQRGRCQWGSVDKDLAMDFYEIISSLGERAVLTSKLANGFGKEVMYYEVSWQPSNFIPVRLQRKVSKCKKRQLNVRNSIKSIELVDSVPTQCIAVDSFGAVDENDLRKSYLIGRGFYVTHNTAVRRGWKICPKTGISQSKLKVVEAAFDYDEKVENDWAKSQPTYKNDNFDEEEVSYEDLNTPNNQ